MLSLLKKSTFTLQNVKNPAFNISSLLGIQTDIHSHLLPGIDDGSKNMEESLSLIRRLSDLGYKKLVTTPHIMSDFYKNTPEIILGKLAELRKKLEDEKIEIQIEAAAEYFLDHVFIRMLEANEKLLTFGDNYLLFETSFYNEPKEIEEVIFQLQAAGYKPVLAHPERYEYLLGDVKKLEKWMSLGLKLQLNLNSLSSYYSRPVMQWAEKLIEQKFISFAGTDCHGSRHLESLVKIGKHRLIDKLRNNSLLNNSL